MCLHVEFSKTLMVWILRLDLLALWAILSFYQSYSKEDIFVSNTGLIIS